MSESESQPATRWWPAVTCVLITLALGWSSLSAELVYDDLLVIRRNPRITNLASWPSAFSATYWEFLQPEVAARVAYWRPLATLAHTITYALGNGTTAAFHLLSVGAHLLAVVAAYRLAARLSRSTSVAFWSALLFGLHPINVESWAWVSALNGILAGLFTLLALHAHLAWRERGSRGVPLAAPALFALALLSKEVAVAALPLFPALDLLTVGTRTPAKVRAWAPAAGVVSLYWFARVAVFGEFDAGLGRITTDFGPDVDSARLFRLRAELLGGGLRLAFWPEPHLFRPFRPVVPLNEPGFAIDAVTILAALGSIVWFARRGLCLAAVAAAIAVLGISPILVRVTSLGSFPLSDRFLYLPSLGAALLVASLLHRLAPSWIAHALLALAAVGAFWKSHERAATWHDEESLFRTAVEQSPDTSYVHWGLGRVMLEKFRTDGDPEHLNAALHAFETSADLLERSASDSSLFATRQDAEQTNVGLGWAYFFDARRSGGDYQTPERIFRLAIQGSPRSKDAHTGLGVTQAALGAWKEAERSLLKAIEIDERHVPGHFNLASLLFERGEWKRALYHTDKVLEYEPTHFEAMLLAARAHRELGHDTEALEAAERTEELHGDRPEPVVLQAQIALGRGATSEALTLLDRALRLDPDHGPAHYFRGILFVQAGEVDAGIASWRRSCELMPKHFPSHHNLGATLLKRGAVEAAKPPLATAYALVDEPRMLVTLRQTLGALAAEDADFATLLGDVDAARPDALSAERFYATALEHDPDHLRARVARADWLYRNDRVMEAVADLSAAVELAPDTFRLRLQLGEWLLEIGRPEEARVELERARELGIPKGTPPEFEQAVRSRLERLLEEVGA